MKTTAIILTNKELCEIFDLTKECFGIDELDISTLHDSWFPLMDLRSEHLNEFALPISAKDYAKFSNAVFDNKHTTYNLEDFESDGLKLARYAMCLIA